MHQTETNARMENAIVRLNIPNFPVVINLFHFLDNFIGYLQMLAPIGVFRVVRSSS